MDLIFDVLEKIYPQKFKNLELLERHPVFVINILFIYTYVHTCSHIYQLTLK